LTQHRQRPNGRSWTANPPAPPPPGARRADSVP
jgi:hypothetical protein